MFGKIRVLAGATTAVFLAITILLEIGPPPASIDAIADADTLAADNTIAPTVPAVAAASITN